ncbi:MULTISPECIES: helix-turn-helix domain-containing protein [Campylobacter]|uniref:helix-turn-helix domain-containing protein n=1 Tax=Campylobacter TaxID=194 RepID=UPI001E2F4545|nr:MULTISPECIES: helix-turn-helix domain-containing protein [Campylobacter]MCR2076708.1 helix-turn-helix domain-containing protein [Campylobacter lari subsp. concheus]MCR2085909.1 helix-turn-helix domain-containing protein [Campylobacter lari subsp. concheus]MCV3488302.1 helix-turn-helix domain-containing protein [Campylobacter lari]MCW0186686.1 helix-turn-helix domain-containing protein [Campylobacter lari]MCW0230475.1 helix-turn-helix domain-containing protein [Campylobacter lari]
MGLDVYKLDSITNERIVINGTLKDKILLNTEIKRGSEKEIIDEILPQITNILGFKPFYHEGGNHIVFKNLQTGEKLYCIEWHFAINTKENIVKKVCKELDITQAELGRQLDVPASTINTWASGKIPKMAEVALTLMLENKQQKEILEAIKKARDFIGRI